jgi:NAD(P)-dependent dehydrogenase (short-subunit alcohol dehydrogenase family)
MWRSFCPQRTGESRLTPVLYNNHGVILGKPFLETTPEEWDRVHDVDLKSVYFLSQRAVPAMRGGSSIINISSVGGLA